MSLRIGDELLLDGAAGRIVAVTDTTDADGRGSISYEEQTSRFRLLKATGPDVPLVATADVYLRVGLLQRKDAPKWFCLVFDDLPVPSGWGRWIEQDRWYEAGELEGQDSVVFVLGWRPGEVTIKQSGEPQAGVFADIVLHYTTDQGEHQAWYQPAYPYNDLQVNWEGVPLRGPSKLGCFKTDANGVLKRHDPDGTLSSIIFPRGLAALGNRQQDCWPSCPQPERYLARAEVWFRQEYAEIAEGVATVLDVAAVELTISGPPGGTYEVGWEDGYQRRIGMLNGSGTAVETGLVPGSYWVGLYHLTDKTKGFARREVSCDQPGGACSVDFGSTWAGCTPGMVTGRVYAYGVTPAVGARVWRKISEFPTYWEVATTTDAGGDFEAAPGFGILIEHDSWGAFALDPVDSYDPQWLDPGLGGRMSVHPRWSTEIMPEGIVLWGVAGDHENLPVGARMGYLKRKDTGQVYWLEATDVRGGCTSEPMPRMRFWWGAGGDPELAPIEYELRADDDTLLIATIYVGASPEPTWVPSIPDNQEMSATGATALCSLGGKYEGNVVEAGRNAPITPVHLADAARMGLEFGTWRQPLEARSDSVSAALVSRPTTLQSFECPYCGGPAWADPDGEGYMRGFCMQCADYGVLTDCRTYFITPTLGTADDWHTRWVRNATSGAYTDRLVEGWPRPEEYDENDDYLVWDWQGFGIPRWVAVHLVLGTWDSQLGFLDGESTADAETRLGRTVGPVMLKLELTEDYNGGGKDVTVTATDVTGQSVTLRVAVPSGSRAGDVIPLDWQPHHHYPRGYYLDVTGMAATGDGALYVRVVNDGPAWHSPRGVQVRRATHSPYACDVSLPERDPFLVEDFAGRLHLVYLRDGQVMHRVLEGTSATWSDPVSIALRANWPHSCREPSLAPLPHAELLAASHTQGATRLWRTTDDGERWE